MSPPHFFARLVGMRGPGSLYPSRRNPLVGGGAGGRTRRSFWVLALGSGKSVWSFCAKT